MAKNLVTHPDAGPEGQVEAAGQEEKSPIFVCRAALATLRIETDIDDQLPVPRVRELSRTVESDIREALAADARVSEVLPTKREFEVDNASLMRLFELRDFSSDLLDSFDYFHAIRFNESIQFSIRIPRKNQPRYRNLDDVPSDEYQVLWNGMAVFVQWKQDDRYATGSGGHVVFEILTDTALAAGYEVEIHACSPGCFHRFIHGDFVTFDEACGDSDVIHSHGRTPTGRSVSLPFDADFDDPARNLRKTAHLLDSVLEAYIKAKSSADEILFLEQKIHFYNQELLTISYFRAARSPITRPIAWVKERFELRGAQRDMRKDVASIWLSLARIEAEMRTWAHFLRVFKERISERHMEDVSDLLELGEDAIDQMDLTLARDSITEASSRLEGRLLLAATGAGAIAAIVGGTIATILT
jgi:hypothetical protein